MMEKVNAKQPKITGIEINGVQCFVTEDEAEIVREYDDPPTQFWVHQGPGWWRMYDIHEVASRVFGSTTALGDIICRSDIRDGYAYMVFSRGKF